jgi:phosphoenolpyruvate carboxykinase (ATP)
VFNVLIPDSCAGVPTEVLTPRNTWRDRESYDRKARELAERFRKNFEQYAEYAGEKVVAAGPRIL